MDVSQSGTSKRLCTAKDPLRGESRDKEASLAAANDMREAKKEVYQDDI